MVIGIFGEGCAGKTTLANAIKEKINATLFSGKDYLRLFKSESQAMEQFVRLLQNAVKGEHIIYVISEIEHLEFLPEGAVRILVTAELSTIKNRFAARMLGALPPTVEAMIERRHGCFDSEHHDIKVKSENYDANSVCEQVLNLCK